MSILSEYEQIRQEMGEKAFNDIERFLEDHPDLYLSDIYYRQSVNEQFQKWLVNK